jgi:hypothetical protein
VQVPLVLASPYIDLLGLLLAPLDDLQERHQRLTLIIIQIQRRRVGYPTMNTSSTRVYPEKVLETKRI